MITPDAITQKLKAVEGFSSAVRTAPQFCRFSNDDALAIDDQAEERALGEHEVRTLSLIPSGYHRLQPAQPIFNNRNQSFTFLPWLELTGQSTQPMSVRTYVRPPLPRELQGRRQVLLTHDFEKMRDFFNR